MFEVDHIYVLSCNILHVKYHSRNVLERWDVASAVRVPDTGIVGGPQVVRKGIVV